MWLSASGILRPRMWCMSPVPSVQPQLLFGPRILLQPNPIRFIIFLCVRLLVSSIDFISRPLCLNFEARPAALDRRSKSSGLSRLAAAYRRSPAAICSRCSSDRIRRLLLYLTAQEELQNVPLESFGRKDFSQHLHKIICLPIPITVIYRKKPAVSNRICKVRLALVDVVGVKPTGRFNHNCSTGNPDLLSVYTSIISKNTGYSQLRLPTGLPAHKFSSTDKL